MMFFPIRRLREPSDHVTTRALLSTPSPFLRQRIVFRSCRSTSAHPSPALVEFDAPLAGRGSLRQTYASESSRVSRANNLQFRIFSPVQRQRGAARNLLRNFAPLAAHSCQKRRTLRGRHEGRLSFVVAVVRVQQVGGAIRTTADAGCRRGLCLRGCCCCCCYCRDRLALLGLVVLLSKRSPSLSDMVCFVTCLL